jgi:hypothetical protein
MSRFAEENKAFIKTIKMLPKMIVELGYNPIHPSIINSRTGIYMTIIALFRLPEVHTNKELVLFLTSQIGKDLAIDPYELLSPLNYRTVSGTTKLEYRTQADSRAYTVINELINDCKFLNRELLNLKKLSDAPEKVDYIVNKASITFKRIVSLKEFSFGGAYLLDEDIFEHIKDFTSQLNVVAILADTALVYTDFTEKLEEINTLVKSTKKLETLKSDGFEKLFFKCHENVEKIHSQVSNKTDDLAKMIRVIDESITYSQEFYKRSKNSGDGAFEASAFQGLPEGLKQIKEEFQRDQTSLHAKFNSLYNSYLSVVPEQIKSHGKVNPSHMKTVCKKYNNCCEVFLAGLGQFMVLNHKAEFGGTFKAIDTFYLTLTALYQKNKSFKNSVDKSFKFKKCLKL